MSVLEVTRTVSVEVDELVGFDEIEEAAVAFARSAPGQLVGGIVESLTETLLEMVVGRRRHPTAPSDQLEAPWSCTRENCENRRGVPPAGVPFVRSETAGCLWRGEFPDSSGGVSQVWASFRACLGAAGAASLSATHRPSHRVDYRSGY